MAKKSKNSKASQQVAKAVDRGTAGLISRSAPIHIDVVKAKVEEIILEPRYHPAFQGKTTKRKDSSAPMPIVGATRDIVDSTELLLSIGVEKTGRGANVEYSITSDVPYLDKIEEQFNLSEIVKSELNIN
jgi:hypothetical protein